MKILVVDDEFISRKMMEKIIEKLGDCQSVDSGGAALDAFNDAWNAGLPYDLIFLDISMPDMSGVDVLKNIRHIEKNKKLLKNMQVQILMMTAHSDKENVMECIELGCNSYIIKPATKEKIAEKLKHLDISHDIL